jgi:hypothetical protein
MFSVDYSINAPEAFTAEGNQFRISKIRIFCLETVLHLYKVRIIDLGVISEKIITTTG